MDWYLVQKNVVSFLNYPSTLYRRFKFTLLSLNHEHIFNKNLCILACPSGTSTAPLSSSQYANTCFGTPTSSKADPETTTKNNCKCQDQCRADMTRNFAIEDSCNTEGGFFGQCGEGIWPFKYDWCR